MSYQVLARKWRPHTFAEVLGQGHVLKALVNALDGDRLHHAYLFTGTRGVGKTTLARVFAKALNCERGVSSQPCGTCSACEEIDGGRFVDLIEVDAASRTKVDETRDLLDNVPYAPTRARYKVYLIDEVHMFSNHSFNALLKTLEEPPAHVKFLLATTDPKKLPVTILSRCLQFNLTRLGVGPLSEHLAKVLDAEGVAYESPALVQIAQAAAGSVRDALSLLDQAIAHGGGRIETVEVARMLGTIDQDRVLKLLEILFEGDARALIAASRELATYAPDYAQVLGELLALLRRMAVAQALDDLAAEVESDARVRALAARIPGDECQLYYQIALLGRRDLPYAPDPESGFEMVLLRMLAFRPASPGTASLTAPVARPAAADVAGAAPRAQPAVEASVQHARPVAPVAPAIAPAAPPSDMVQAAVPEPLQAKPTPVATAAATALDWTLTSESLGLAGLPRELARNSALARFDGRVVELVIAPQFERLAQRRHIETLQSALSEHLGRDIRVDVRIEHDEQLQTPSQQRGAEAEQRQRDAEASIANDPHVRMLRDTFDATIEDVSAR